MQMSDIPIPAAVVEAAARAITMALILAVEDDCRALALTDDERTELARAALTAGLAAWPGMFVNGDDEAVDIILPVPAQEKTDDQA